MRRFFDKVKRVESSCWEWQGGTLLPPLLPYGRVKISGKEYKTHRLSWEIVFGPIPTGLWVLHKCDNPKCVSPFHLFLGTPTDNVRDCVRKSRRKKIRGRYRTGFGELHPNSKLTVEMVREIRLKYVPNVYGAQRLSKEFGVSKPVIFSILKRKHWQSVP